MQAILGATFSRLRVARHITQQRAAQALHYDPSRISKLESGECLWNEDIAGGLLNLYQVDPAESSKYLAWARQVRDPWWPDACDDGDTGLDDLLDQEPMRRIRGYGLTTVPELLQTADYARAALELTLPNAPADQIEQLVAARLRRQTVLRRAEPPIVWLVVEETALRRRIGGEAVWHRQIEHLIALLDELPWLRVQIIDEAEQGPLLAHHEYSLLRFVDAALPDLVCVRELTGTMCFDLPGDTKRYLETSDAPAARAAPPRETVDRLSALR